jgi:uncharacterized membrane protein
MAEAENSQKNNGSGSATETAQTAPNAINTQPADQGQQVADQSSLQASAVQAQKDAGQLTGGFMQGMDKLKQTGVTGMFKKAENQPAVNMEEKLWAGISYIPLVAIVALIIKPESGFIKLHGRQGLLIFLIFFFCIFVYLVPFIGPLFGGLIQLALFVLGVFSMYQAFVGNWWKIPVIGDLAEVIPLSLFEKVTKEVITGQPSAQESQSSEGSQGVGAEPSPSEQTQQSEPPKEQPPAA